MITAEEMAERMKLEILADVRIGCVPATVKSFSELHDYVDANLYGGTEELLLEIEAVTPADADAENCALTKLCALCNPAMDLVDAWIKAGGITKHFEEYPTCP